MVSVTNIIKLKNTQSSRNTIINNTKQVLPVRIYFRNIINVFINVNKTDKSIEFFKILFLKLDPNYCNLNFCLLISVK